MTLFADEGIKKMAQSIKPSLSFPAGGCPNATLSGEKFTLGATTNPNGTPVTNKPGEQTGQYVWTWTGNGAGGQFVSVRVVIDYQDPPIGALKLSKFAEMFVPRELRFHTISHVHLHSVFSYVLDVFNPNSAPAQIHIRDPLPEGWRSEGLPSAPWAGGGCRLDHDILFCHDTVAPKGHLEFRVPGEFRMPGERVNVATAYGTCDGVELPAVKAERSLHVLPQRR